MVQSAFIRRMYSSVTAPRSANGGAASASNSSGHHPTPTPTISRPPDIASIVASCFAVTTGLR